MEHLYVKVLNIEKHLKLEALQLVIRLKTSLNLLILPVFYSIVIISNNKSYFITQHSWHFKTSPATQNLATFKRDLIGQTCFNTNNGLNYVVNTKPKLLK